jgi:4-amino-4-deoxy-L-arabinose transferase-like glycosyltransferase
VTIRLLRSEDQRWWLALGAVVGMGMMTKFTMAFLLAGIVGGIILTRPRWLLNKCLWYGAAIRDFPSQSHLAGPARFHHA